ncbi:MAG TPA: DRTGG domain-containing protein [Bacteroidales bacterium]|nr:DRTGG domain-containing protein [Bacteroidales bacterium]
MKIGEIVRKLNLKVVAGENGLGNEVTGGYTSDLLSDVIGNANAGFAWITLQTHHNIVAVALLKELSAVIIVKGLKAAEETVKKADEENIPVLSTDDDTFTFSGKLFELLKG